MDADHWLELSEAAQILKLHPSTLRRWSDAGKIAHIRTLSGRRRFDPLVIEQVREEIEQTGAGQHQAAETIGLTTLAPDQVHASAIFQEDWVKRLTDEQKLIFRYSGQRLLELMLQYINQEEKDEAILVSARRIASDYAAILYKVGLSLSQSVQAYLAFRRSILDFVQVPMAAVSHNDRDGQRVMLRATDFFDVLLIETINSYLKLSKPDA